MSNDQSKNDEWWRPFTPIDLGDGNHRVGWQKNENGSENLWFIHLCLVNGERKLQLGWIDLASGKRHRLINRDPLHIEASVACSGGCGDHGFIRGGSWQSA